MLKTKTIDIEGLSPLNIRELSALGLAEMSLEQTNDDRPEDVNQMFAMAAMVQHAVEGQRDTPLRDILDAYTIDQLSRIAAQIMELSGQVDVEAAEGN